MKNRNREMSMIKNIVPTPKSVQIYEGTENVLFLIDNAYAEWDKYVETFSDATMKLFENPLSKGDGIKLNYDASIAPKSYRLGTLGSANLCSVGLHFDKTIINRFVLVHQSSRIVAMRHSNTRFYSSLLH